MLHLSPHLHPADPKISTRPRSAQDHPAGQPKKAKVEVHLCLEISPLTGGEASERETAMGRFRSLIAQSPAIVISLLAVVLSVGGGAYASTQLSAANSAAASHTVTAGVSWTSLSLINGWVSENAAFASATPNVAQQSNILY